MEDPLLSQELIEAFRPIVEIIMPVFDKSKLCLPDLLLFRKEI